MTQNAAIAYIAVGQEARGLCRLSVRTLRSCGWDGPVKVLTEAPLRVDDATEVAVIPEHVLNTDPEAPDWGYEIDCRDFVRPSAGDAVKQLTPLMPRFFDLRGLDLVLQLDVDIVANRPVPETIARLHAEPADFGVSLNRVARLTRTPASTGNLTRWETLRWRRAANINSGLFFFRPNPGGMEILRAWYAELAKRIRGDQAALQAIFLRHYRDRIATLDLGYQAFPPTPRHYDGELGSLERVDADFAHFRGAIKDPVVMRDYIAKFGLLTSEEVSLALGRS